MSAWTLDDTKATGKLNQVHTILYEIAGKLIFEPWMSTHLEHLRDLSSCSKQYIQFDIPQKARAFIKKVIKRTFFDLISLVRQDSRNLMCILCESRFEMNDHPSIDAKIRIPPEPKCVIVCKQVLQTYEYVYILRDFPYNNQESLAQHVQEIHNIHEPELLSSVIEASYSLSRQIVPFNPQDALQYARSVKNISIFSATHGNRSTTVRKANTNKKANPKRKTMQASKSKKKTKKSKKSKTKTQTKKSKKIKKKKKIKNSKLATKQVKQIISNQSEEV